MYGFCRHTLAMTWRCQTHATPYTKWMETTGVQTLNHCRVYLKVFRLSDIVIGSSKSITQQFWDRPHPADSPFEWPKTMAPPLMAWNSWHQALTSALHLGRNQRLAIPLG